MELNPLMDKEILLQKRCYNTHFAKMLSSVVNIVPSLSCHFPFLSKTAAFLIFQYSMFFTYIPLTFFPGLLTIQTYLLEDNFQLPSRSTTNTSLTSVTVSIHSPICMLYQALLNSMTHRDDRYESNQN